MRKKWGKYIKERREERRGRESDDEHLKETSSPLASAGLPAPHYLSSLSLILLLLGYRTGNTDMYICMYVSMCVFMYFCMHR